MKEKAAYLKGLIDGLGIDENTKEGKVIKAMSEMCIRDRHHAGTDPRFHGCAERGRDRYL